MPPPYDIRCGTYILRTRIGSGAMAQVWRAEHVDGDHEAAVKIVTGRGFESQSRRRRFHREVSAHAGLHHPHIVDVYDTGDTDERTVETSEGGIEAGRPYLAMECSEIGSLRNYLPVPNWDDLRRLLLQLLSALGHAHAHHVIHRDLKPGNVLVFASDDDRAHLKISDFGMAHATSQEYDRGTDQVPMPSGGTPVYMAPEQLRANWRDFGPWTDLYTLGILAFETACARPPYLGNDFFELAEKHLAAEPLDLDPVLPVPDAFESWVQTLTATHPADRFRSAADAARSLEAIEERPPERSSVRSDGNDRKPADSASFESVEPISSTLSRQGTKQFPASSTRDEAGVEARTDFGRADERLDLDEIGRESTDLEDGFPREIPNDWRDASLPDPAGRSHLGLELFQLVEAAFVDRDSERDLLWEAAVDVFETGDPRAVVLHGTSGMGKSRLATWLVRRLRESGLFRSLETLHPRDGAPLDGLRQLVERRFRTWNLDRSGVYERLQRGLERQLGLAREVVRAHDSLVRGLTELLRPTPAGAPADEFDYFFGSRAEQYTVLDRLLALVGHERPVVVRIDDLPGGSATVDWVRRTLDRRDVPVLWLLTSDDEAEPLPADLVDRPATRTVELGPLTPADQRVLVESLLPIDRGVADLLRSHTGGSPLFALHLVRHWAHAGLLEPGERGYRLVDSRRPPLPRTLPELWDLRVDAILAELPADERPDARAALEAAAALGDETSFVRWTDVAARLDCAVSTELVEALSRRGLIHLDRSGLQFTHRTLVESIRDGARRADRWQKIQGALAASLDDGTDRHTKRSAERAARHWIAAGDVEKGFERLEDAIDLARGHQDHERFERLLGLHADQLSHLPAGRERPHRLYNLVQQIPLELLRDDPEAAQSAFRRGIELSRAGPYELERAHLLRSGALVQRHRGDHEICLEMLDEAHRRFQKLSNDIGLAETFRERGITHALSGRSEAAIRALDRASAAYLAADDEIRSLEARIWQGTAFVFSDELDRAEQLAEGLLERAAELGAPNVAVDAHNLLGEVERFRGHPERARYHYLRALRQGNRIGVVSLPYRLNLAFTDLARGRPASAADGLEELEAEHPEFIGGSYRIYFALVRAAAAAARGDWSEWESHVDDASEAADELLQHSAIDRDPPWVAARAADCTRRAGDPDRADRLDALAERLRDWFETA